MARKQGARTKASVPGLGKSSTYTFSPELALELELYGTIKKHGTKKDIIEQSLSEFFDRNPLPKRLREAALLIIEEGASG